VPEIVRARRVPVPIGSAAGAVLGAGERIFAECHSRRRADAMVQCKAACLVRWFHKSCGDAISSMSVGDWVCSPCAVVVPASPSGSPLHTHRRQRREGPWRSRAKAGAHSFFLSCIQCLISRSNSLCLRGPAHVGPACQWPPALETTPRVQEITKTTRGLSVVTANIVQEKPLSTPRHIWANDMPLALPMLLCTAHPSPALR
jgi:hypothetical protein